MILPVQDQQVDISWLVIPYPKLPQTSPTWHRVGRSRGDGVSVPLKFCETGGGSRERVSVSSRLKLSVCEVVLIRGHGKLFSGY